MPFFSLSLVFCGLAHAQEPVPSSVPDPLFVHPDITHIDMMEAARVDGAVFTPRLAVVRDTQRSRHCTLVLLRTNFRTDMKASVGEAK
jgi:hypothetical protein